jgi:curved DNA-binding protein CbpA
MPPRSHFDVLQIAPSASSEEVKRAYFRAAKTSHPDKGGSDTLFQDVQQAYAVLSDEAARRKYQQGLFQNRFTRANVYDKPAPPACPPKPADAKYGEEYTNVHPSQEASQKPKSEQKQKEPQQTQHPVSLRYLHTHTQVPVR